MNTPYAKRILLALALFVLVVVLEWWSRVGYSLGIFYLFAVVAAATVATRLQVLAAAALCAYVRSFFTPELPPVEFWLRFAMAMFAYAGIGLWVVEMSRGRRAMQEAYARLQLEQRLRDEVERRLAMLVDSSPAGIVTLNGKGEVIAANKASQRLLGFESQERMLGASLGERVPIYAGALTYAQPVRTATATWASRVDGTSLPIATWFSTYQENNERYLAAIMVDTSEEVRDRERESFRQLADAHRLFAGAVSHEIRNLCSAINVVSSNLAARHGLRESSDFAALGSLVDNLAALAAWRLEASRDRSVPQVQLRSALEQLRVVIGTDWSDAGAELVWSIDQANVNVRADPQALTQTFLNLTQNSLRAVLGREQPRLAISVAMRAERAVVRFEDSGGGIDDASTLFQPFRPGADNVGLGLFISRTLVRSFDGDLAYVPTDRGCCFEVILVQEGER